MALLEVGSGQPYSTIQAAVNDSPAGMAGSVRVNAGGVLNQYPEAVVVNNKRIRLSGALPKRAVGIVGAGAGAAPALQVTGSGGVFVDNLFFSNVGSAAAYVVELNVAEDWISRCEIDGGGSKVCLQSQFGDNVMLKNGTKGVEPSCPGQAVYHHFTCVNMSIEGIRCNAGSELVGTLTYNCNGLGLINAGANYSAWNFTSDETARNLPGSRGLVSLAEFAFVDYAGGNFELLPSTLAYASGMAFFPLDYNGSRRLRETARYPVIVAGCHDPLPDGPLFLSGAANLRTV